MRSPTDGRPQPQCNRKKIFLRRLVFSMPFGPSDGTGGGGGGGRDLLQFSFRKGGGGDPPPWTPYPPPPPPPSAQVHLKTWVLGTYFSHVKKISAPLAHAIYCVRVAPCVLHIPCLADHHAPTLVVSVFPLPVQPLPRTKREDVIDALLHFRFKDRITGRKDKKPTGECLPGARLTRYFSINYPDFSPRFTLPWRSPLSRPHCTAHLPYKARCEIKQDL